MSALVRSALVAGVGLIGSHAYYQWLLRSAIHKGALEQFGLVGYWGSLAVPVLLLCPLLAFCMHHKHYPAWVVVVVAFLGALAIASLGLLGTWILCVFLTKGICE
jgi:hypothetical protein